MLHGNVLQNCSALDKTREKLAKFTQSYVRSHPQLTAIVEQHCNPNSRLFTQFIIDCSTIPDVIATVQLHDKEMLTHLYNTTRIWCYSICGTQDSKKYADTTSFVVTAVTTNLVVTVLLL